MKNNDQKDNRSRDSDQDTRGQGSQPHQNRSENAGNFANDPERAREAGRKGGLS